MKHKTAFFIKKFFFKWFIEQTMANSFLNKYCCKQLQLVNKKSKIYLNLNKNKYSLKQIKNIIK